MLATHRDELGDGALGHDRARCRTIDANAQPADFARVPPESMNTPAFAVNKATGAPIGRRPALMIIGLRNWPGLASFRVDAASCASRRSARLAALAVTAR